MSETPREPSAGDPVDDVWREVRPAQLALLHRLVADVGRLEADEGDGATWERVRDAAHRLAGTLCSFGREPAGETATTLDELVSDADGPDDVPRAQLRALTVALHEALPHSAAECLTP